MSKQMEASPLPPNAIILIGNDGRISHFIDPETHNNSHAFTGKICAVFAYDDTGLYWWEEIGVIFLKWDGCAHIGLRDPDLGNEWTHVCGEPAFRRTIEALEWAWSVAKSRIPAWDATIAEK